VKKLSDTKSIDNKCPKCQSENTETIDHDYADGSHIEIKKACRECGANFATMYDFTNGVKYLC
jgi:transcriptional regulator NrdR family protein